LIAISIDYTAAIAAVVMLVIGLNAMVVLVHSGTNDSAPRF